MVPRTWMFLAAMLGLTAVGAGALGAHALEKRLEPDSLADFMVAVRYQMYSALALLAISWVMSLGPTRWGAAAAALMFIGAVLFSGSIYGLVLLDWKWLWPFTPAGGVIMMLGWLCLGVAATRIGAAKPDPG